MHPQEPRRPSERHPERYPLYPEPKRSANGSLILVLGILSMVGCGCITGLPAWIMANRALESIDRGDSNPEERGIVVAGRILGIIATVLGLIFVAFYGAMLLYAMGMSRPSPNSGFEGLPQEVRDMMEQGD